MSKWVYLNAVPPDVSFCNLLRFWDRSMLLHGAILHSFSGLYDVTLYKQATVYLSISIWWPVSLSPRFFFIKNIAVISSFVCPSRGHVWDFSRIDTKNCNCLAISNSTRYCQIAVQDDCINSHQLYMGVFIPPHPHPIVANTWCCQTCTFLPVQWVYCLNLHFHYFNLHKPGF